MDNFKMARRELPAGPGSAGVVGFKRRKPAAGLGHFSRRRPSR
jgi:hypothetical protein